MPFLKQPIAYEQRVFVCMRVNESETALNIKLFYIFYEMKIKRRQVSTEFSLISTQLIGTLTLHTYIYVGQNAHYEYVTMSIRRIHYV